MNEDIVKPRYGDAPFKDSAKCAKCTSGPDGIVHKYSKKQINPNKPNEYEEWMEHKCSFCGFTWNTQPADCDEE